MNSLLVQLRSMSRTRTMQLSLALTVLVIPVSMSFAATPANAGWGGGHLGRTSTQITDVSHLTIIEGTKALGLTTLASVLPDDAAELLDNSNGVTVFAPTDEAFAKGFRRRAYYHR